MKIVTAGVGTYKYKLCSIYRNLCIYVYVYTHTYTHTHTHTYIYIYTHTHTHTYIYICVCVCVCVCILSVTMTFKLLDLDKYTIMCQSNTKEPYYIYHCIRATCFDSYRIILRPF